MELAKGDHTGMAVDFHTLKVREVHRETPDTVVVAFDVPDTLKEVYTYVPGQYLTIRPAGKKERRSYSICTCSLAGEPLKVAVKRVEGGVISNYVNDVLAAGDDVDVMPPMGNFTMSPDSARKQHYVLVAAGSGVTPIMSILKGILLEEEQSTVSMLYCNREWDNVIFRDELLALAEKYSERFTLANVLSRPHAEWDGQKGRMDAFRLKMILPSLAKSSAADAQYYMCGPSGLMQEVQKALDDLHVPHSNVHREYFTQKTSSDHLMSATVENTGEEVVVSDTPVDSKVTLRIGGNDTIINVPAGDSITNAAIEAEIDPPYACQLGVCCTCRAKLVKGKVRMDEREALTDSEIADGFVLTCQSHPLTTEVIVDFDN